jgi:hypothetical protein
MRKDGGLLIITDVFHPDLEGTPVCRLLPDLKFRLAYLVAIQHTIFTQFLAVMGFSNSEFASAALSGRAPLFTIVAQRSVLKAESRMLGASRFPAIAL